MSTIHRAQRLIVVGLLWCSLLTVSGVSMAQSALDGFNADVTAGRIVALAVADDGKIMIGGEFNLNLGTRVVARLHPDGSRDTSFGWGFTPPLGGQAMAVHPIDDGYLVGGSFVGGGFADHLVRLAMNGSVVGAFDLNVNGDVRAIERAIDASGFYIGGEFTAVNGVIRHRIARLTSTLEADNAFAPPVFNGAISAIAPLADGKVLVGGSFLSVDSQPGAGYAVFRLNANGSLDNSFHFDIPAGIQNIQSIAVQADGRILIAGDFLVTVGSETRRRVARLDADGSVDLSYEPPALNGLVSRMQMQPDGRAVIVGAFTGVGLANRIARLNHDGSADAGFALLQDPNDDVFTVAVQRDGGVLFAGEFTQITNVAALRVARIAKTGGLDADFAPPAGTTAGNVLAVASLSSGDVLAGGSFTTIAGQPRTYLARFSGATGALSGGFTPTLNGTVSALLVQPDGRFVVGGEFTLVNGAQRRRLARFNADGTLDSGFVPAAIPDGAVRALELAPDGKIYVGGSFQSIGGEPRAHFARLNGNGTLDTSFSNTGVDDDVLAIAMEWDQHRVYIAGDFTDVGGFDRAHVARVWPHGVINNGFNAGAVSGSVSSLTAVPDGGVIIAGSFGSTRIAQLDEDGAVDTGFFADVNGTILSLARDTLGRVYIGGSFSSVNGLSRQRLARLLPDGDVDTSFADPAVSFTPLPTAAVVWSLALQGDGRLVLAGAFSSVAGTARSGIARLGNRGGIPAEQLVIVPGFEAMIWARNHGAAHVRGRPELLVSTTCCAATDFEVLPGGLVSADGSVWFYEGFPNPTGTYYAKVRTRVGDGRGAGLYETPVHVFFGGEQPVAEADLEMAKEVLPTQAPVGSTVVFVLTVNNAGPDAATDVAVQDLLPSGYGYVSHETEQGTYEPDTGLWKVKSLAAAGAGAEAVLKIEAVINPGGPYLNTASASGSEFDPDIGNNVATAEVGVLPPDDDVIFANGFQ